MVQIRLVGNGSRLVARRLPTFRRVTECCGCIAAHSEKGAPSAGRRPAHHGCPRLPRGAYTREHPVHIGARLVRVDRQRGGYARRNRAGLLRATTYLTNHIIQRYARVWRDRLALLVCLSLLASYAWGGVTGQGILVNSEPICHYQAQTREDSFGEQVRDYNIFILNGSQFVNETGLMSRGLGWLKGCLVANAPCNNKSN